MTPGRPSAKPGGSKGPRARRISVDDRRVLALAVPALATLAVEPLYVLVDTGIVGRLGTAPLGGLALASSVLNASFWIFNFLSFGTTSRVAFLTGRGDDTGAAEVASQGLWLSAGIGVVAAIGVALLARPAAVLLGGKGAVLEAAVTYLRISAVGVPFVLVALVGNGFFRGLSDTRTPFRVVLVANVVNLALEVILVYGAHLGVAGSAWGTVAAQALAAAWFAGMVGQRVAGTGATRRPVARVMRQLAVVGRHLFVRTGALLAALTLATSVAARIDGPTLAAHQVALQVWLFLTLALDSLAIASQALTGTLLGQGDEAEARRLARRSLRLGLMAGAAVGGGVLALSPVLAAAFTSDPNVRSRAWAALVVVAALQVPGAALWVLDGALMGASDFRFLQWGTITALAAFVPLAGVVLAWHRLGIVGLWLGLSVWLGARLLMNAVRFAGPRWTTSAGYT